MMNERRCLSFYVGPTRRLSRAGAPWRGYGWRRSCLLLPMLILLAVCLPAGADERPNIVWIVSEDNSVHFMELFDPTGPPTPNIERLAEEGIAFERAFSNSPVCSVARTTLATGIYAPRVATQHHRNLRESRLPDGWRMFPAYLRDAGYYTTNNRKKDYNAVEGEGVWDASSGEATWRDRPSKQTPFFHMESHGVSHEGRLHFDEQQIDPAALTTDPDTVTLFPYFPDTDLFRYTTAYYHDRIRRVDDVVGETVAKLEADGLLEDTFIFYFGDHGGTLPRSKGYLYEGGLHVPLVVRVPENFTHLVDLPRGSRSGGFVSFVDFGPTAMHLAGLEVPEHMDGRAFLGPDVSRDQLERRDETLGYADRFDEKCDMVRSLRKGDYKYIRAWHPYYPDDLQNNYRVRMLAWQQWRQMYADDALDDAVQRQFFEARPVEMLFDLSDDPHETKNLADDPAYADVLADLRGRLQQRLRAMPDLSFLPESVLIERAVENPHAFAQRQKDRIEALITTADLALLPFEEARDDLEAAIASDDPWQRYWALVACAAFAEDARPLADAGRALLADDERLVRVRAAEFLAMIDAVDPRPTLLDVLSGTDSPAEALLTLNTVVFVRDHLGYAIDADALELNVEHVELDRRLEYLRQPPPPGRGR